MNFDKLWDITELQYNILNQFGCVAVLGIHLRICLIF